MSSPEGHSRPAASPAGAGHRRAPEPIVTFRRKVPDVNPRILERFARQLRDRVAGGRDFHCLITGDTELQRLNRDFLNRDYPTDVLSFPAGAGPSLGDIAISIQRARAQARRFGHSLQHELGILMLHGVLHLLGMNHETDRGGMARAERRWRRALALPSGLIERARV